MWADSLSVHRVSKYCHRFGRGSSATLKQSVIEILAIVNTRIDEKYTVDRVRQSSPGVPVTRLPGLAP
jgi:hypothetical protein